jgi:uncharacterized protein (DUF2384 family)
MKITRRESPDRLLRTRPLKPFSTEVSERLRKYPEILARAAEIFGSQERAERWLKQPALDLEQQRPIDLLETSAGAKLVEDFLIRLKYEVYVRATEIFGSRDEAVRWLTQPALGLDQQRPIDLLQTPAGVKLVKDFLGRLKYGVYN